MKKTLSVVLTSAMALSMFSSLAFAAKSSADFTDLKDLDAATKAKFDAMITAGIFDGVTDTTFGLKDEMNRAQFAKVAALIMGLEVNKDLKTSTFTDVSVTDAANGYALPYIEALKTAGVTDGYAEGQYNPAGKVTKEQLATFLVRVLGQDAAAKGKTGTDTTVSGWAQGYVALALELKLLSNGTDGKFGGMANATRDLLVTGAYEAKQQYVPAGKVSLTEAKATGVQQVTVSFNKPVDTDKAKLALTKGTTDVATTVKFNTDKKSAVLTLVDSKIGAGDYSVTLSGIDAAAVDKATAKFTAEAETVSKIEFVNAGDTLAYSANVRVALKATNQYGEVASVGNSAFTAFVNGTQATLKGSDGNLTVETITNGGTFVQGQSVIPVTVYYNDTRVTATKNFKLGTAPFLSKVELGDVVYSNGNKALSAANDTATIPVKLYDQYGNPVVAAQVPSEISASTINAIVAPYSQNVVYDNTAPLFDTDGNAQIVVKMAAKEDKTADYNVTVYAGSSSATTKVAVAAGKLATKIDFGTFTGNVAAGDTKTFYVPLVATDANGNTLSAQDIVDNAKANRFTFSGNNTAATPEVEYYGEHKGQLKFTLNGTAKAKSNVYLTALIATTNANSYAQTSVAVQEQRYPDHIVVDTDGELAPKAILGAKDDFKLLVKDQYGDTFDQTGLNIANANNQAYDYQVAVTISGDTAASGISFVDKASSVTTYNDTTKTHAYTGAGVNDFNSGFTAKTTSGSTGTVTFKAVVQKRTAGSGTYTDFSAPISRSIEAVKSSADLTYTLDTLGTTYSYIDSKPGAISGTDVTDPTQSMFGKKVSVIAKDSAGSTIALPDNAVRGVTVSDASVANVAYDGANDAYVLGNKAGKATVTAVVYTNKGNTILLSQDITVKSDAIVVDSITTDNKTATYDRNLAATTRDSVADFFNNLHVKDQYGLEYKSDGTFATTNPIVKYDAILGIRYTVSDVVGGNVTIDAMTGKVVSVDAGVKEFVVTATAPNGKNVQVLVTAIN